MQEFSQDMPERFASKNKMENKELELIATIENTVKGVVADVQTEVKKTSENLKTIENAIVEQGKEIASLKEKGNAAKENTFSKEFQVDMKALTNISRNFCI